MVEILYLVTALAWGGGITLGLVALVLGSTTKLDFQWAVRPVEVMLIVGVFGVILCGALAGLGIEP